MKTRTTNVECLKIWDVDGLDTISVYFEDFAPSQGKITIECYGNCWSHYWTGLGDRNIKDFFSNCWNDYLIGKFSDEESKIVDFGNIDVWLKKGILKARKEGLLEHKKARELWFDVEAQCENSRMFFESYTCDGIASQIFGNAWFYEGVCPKVDNPRYYYLDKILTTIKNALEG